MSDEVKTSDVVAAPVDSVVILPELRSDLLDFEKAAGISVDVLVRVEGFKDKTIGRYLHGLDEWQVANWTGYPKVVEWWPLPENGTGTAV